MCRNLGSPEVAIAGAKSSDRSRVVPESSLSFRRTAAPTQEPALDLECLQDYCRLVDRGPRPDEWREPYRHDRIIASQDYIR